MIASVRGTVARVGLDHVILDVGGIGLRAHTTPSTAAGLRAGALAELAASLVVREDSLTLYAFGEEDERAVFDLVQTVPGVGPRLALAMLAVHPSHALRRAIGGGDVAALTKVPGIGKKGAERLILELRERIAAAPAPAGAAEGTTAGPPAWSRQVGEALVGLGWSAKQADAAVEAVSDQLGETPEVAVALRAALRELGR